MSVKIVTLSEKKTLLGSSCLFRFVYMDWQIFVIPQDSFIVFIKRLSLDPLFSLSSHLFCLVWFCCLPLHALSFVFYLVWCSGWEVYPLFCHRRPCVLAAVVWEVWLLCPSIFTFMGKSHASQQGWKTASSTAPFLNASRRICGHVALLCPRLWSPLLHSCNLVGSFLLCTFLPRLNVLHGSSGIPDRPVWACSLLVPCG